VLQCYLHPAAPRAAATGHRSGENDGTTRTPAAFALGPTSFTTYLNDICLVVVIALLLLFADDSSAMVKGKTNAETNQKTVEANDQFMGFAEANHLKINATKTKILQIHTYQTRNIISPEINIYGSEVETVQSGKLLGVTYSDTLNWAELKSGR